MNAPSLLRSSAALLAMGVLSSVSQAQVLTADTITVAPPVSSFELVNNSALTQTFTGADALGEVTFRFLVSSGSVGSVTATNVDFVLTSWGANDSTGAVFGAGTFALDAGALWSDGGSGNYFFDSTFDMSLFGPITASTTYGISLFGNVATDSAGIGLGLATDTAYGAGTGYFDAIGNFGDIGSLTTGNTSIGADFSFAATSASPVPEASTAAVLFAGVFVGGLVVRRRRQPAVALPMARA